MDSGVVGIVGVIVGSTLTLAKDWFMQGRRDKREIVLLGYQLATRLERFAHGCGGVALDNGEDDEHGISVSSVLVPRLTIETDASWKHLRIDLLTRVLDLPHKTEEADALISNTHEFDSPPDYSFAFEDRQYEYCRLGLEAADLARQLRKFAGLKVRDTDDADEATMLEVKSNIESTRAKRVTRERGRRDI